MAPCICVHSHMFLDIIIYLYQTFSNLNYFSKIFFLIGTMKFYLMFSTLEHHLPHVYHYIIPVS